MCVCVCLFLALRRIHFACMLFIGFFSFQQIDQQQGPTTTTTISMENGEWEEAEMI